MPSAATLLRLALRLPLYMISTSLAVLFFCCKSATRAKRAGGSGRSEGVLLQSGRRPVFGDTLLFLLGHWAPPDSVAPHFVQVRLQGLDGPGPVAVLPPLGDGQDVRLGVAYLTAESRLRRELLFAWSLGMQATVTGLRCCWGRSARTPEMRVAAVVLPHFRSRDSLLITRRAARGGSYNSMWVFPGGAVDAGESAASAAERELREETGVRLVPGSLQFLCAYQARNEALCLTYLMLIYAGDAEEPCSLSLCSKEVAQAAYLPSAAIDLLLSGCAQGEVDGVAYGENGAELLDRPVALRGLRLAPDGATSTGPGIGAGHWFALREWRRQRPMAPAALRR